MGRLLPALCVAFLTGIAAADEAADARAAQRLESALRGLTGLRAEFRQDVTDAEGRVDFSRPVRRLTEPQALALLWPAPTAEPAQTVASASRPGGWLAALLASLSAAFQRS